MRELTYSPQLDGLRAICIVLTLLNHVEGVPPFINGTVGVDVFFPLSGFLITSILLKSGWQDLKGYYIRRLFRIAPVYYLSFFLTAFLTIVAHRLAIGESRLEQLQNILLPSLLFSREWATNAPTLFGQAWTVGIEEKFYIVWPIVFLLLAINVRRLSFLAAIFLALFLATSAEALRGYGGIALGCISAILFFVRGFHINTAIAASGMVIAYIFCLLSDLWFENLAMALAAAFLIPSLYASKSLISRFLSHPIMVALGKLTFAIYMLHILIFFTVKLALKKLGIDHWAMVFIISYATTVVFSWIVFKLYEDPLIKLGKRLALKKGKQDISSAKAF